MYIMHCFINKTLIIFSKYNFITNLKHTYVYIMYSGDWNRYLRYILNIIRGGF